MDRGRLASQADALVTLAKAIGRSADATKLQARADKQRALIAAHLWDAQASAWFIVDEEATWLVDQ